MRRDMLEIDTAVSGAVNRLAPDLCDVEAMRLMLSGGSVIDWLGLAFTHMDEVDRFLATHLLDMNQPEDRERLRYVFNEALAYLEEHLGYSFPKRLREPDDVRQLFLYASKSDGFRRTQILSCIILKLMHVIQHLEAASLRHCSAVSEQTLLDLAHERVHSAAERMQDEGLPVVAFYGSKKSRSSVITKLISKKENIAATIFDKLRFRIVVNEFEDIFGTMAWLVRNVVPFNYAIPGQSHNNLLDPQVLSQLPKGDLQNLLVDDPVQQTSSKNEFSGSTYRAINFITDFPVRLPDAVPHMGFSFEQGRVVYVMIEFQVLDEVTAKNNEIGENAHFLYKKRQHEVVAKRLKRGLLD